MKTTEPVCAQPVLAVLEREWRRANDDRAEGRYREAESQLLASIERAVAALGEAHLVVAGLRNDLAVTYKYAGRLDAAEPLYRQALRTFEAQLGPDQPQAGRGLPRDGGARPGLPRRAAA